MERLWKSDQGDGSYRNPVLFADYSDPDAIRVGDTFYMTASSFNYIPGLPILTSKDLVNWRLVNYAVRRIDYDAYDRPMHARGIWAPAIRYHSGEFYIYYGMPDEGIFMVKTRDPLGEWEAPVPVLEGKGLIDPCPYWEDDGHAYVVHGYAKSRIGFKSCLGIFPMSSDGTRALAPDHILFNGVETQPTIEGPKVYRRDGYYYILAPAGGVRTGWQAALRSRSIMGPYEERIVMKQGDTPINGPHQGALVDTPSGQEWFVHFQDRGLYGRIVHLQPVSWENGWPSIGVDVDGDGCGRPCLVHEKPDAGVEEPCYLKASDDFSDARLGLQWQWLANARDDFSSLTARPGYLRLYAINPAGGATILWDRANVLTQKIVCPAFRAETKICLDGLENGGRAGLVMMGGHYAYLAVGVKSGRKRLIFAESADGPDGRVIEHVREISAIAGDAAWLRESLVSDCFTMEYSLDGEHFTPVETSFFPTDHTWVGAKIGLFAGSALDCGPAGYADFEYIRVDALE